MDVKIEQSWKNALSAEFDKDYFIKLTDFVRAEYKSGKQIFPEPKNIFNALGKAGRIIVKCNTDRSGTRGGITRRYGLGTIYRCRYRSM